MQDATYMMQV